MVEISEWFTGRLPEDWFAAPLEVTVDRDEILVVGTISAPQEATRASEQGRIERFREDTRTARMTIADSAQKRFARTVSWGVRCGETRQLFTTLAVPVMTRLRLDQRHVLDILVEAGVARSRSEALSWCVRLVADHEGDWIAQLGEALGAVRQARAAGPSSGSR